MGGMHEWMDWGRKGQVVRNFSASVGSPSLHAPPLPHTHSPSATHSPIPTLPSTRCRTLSAPAAILAPLALMQNFRMNALHFAAEKGNTDAIRLLLEHGADIDSKTTV